MLQKYTQRNGMGNNFIPSINTLNFGEKIQVREEHTDESSIELPAAASAGDVRELVRFLSRENASIRINELQNAEPRRVFEPHKLTAYETWGIIVRNENYIRLSDLGTELAKRNTFEKQIYRQILSNLPQYSSVVGWMREQNLKIVTYHDLADFWEDNFPELLLGEKETREIENAALSFFSICHAAELGIMTVGKRGQPTRLNVNVNEINDFLKKVCHPQIEVFNFDVKNTLKAGTIRENQISTVYISLGKRKEFYKLVELLELTDFGVLTAVDISLKNNFLNQSQISLMQKCNFGLFILDETHCRKQNNGTLELLNDKIIEINTALALFNGQIILLWDADVTPPQNIRGTQLSIFVKSNSEWETNLRIAKALKEFTH